MGAAIKETAAAASALAAYLTTVLPRVRRELKQLGPLPPEKAMNTEAVAVFATLAPRPQRGPAVRAIVALQVAIDLRDALEEDGREAGSETASRLGQLEERWRSEIATLPAGGVVRPHLERAVQRCEQGQLNTHRAAREGPESLQGWAEGLEAPPGYRWWELAAGASSSVAAHALIAVAASATTTGADAGAIDAAYHPPVGALTVLLDDLVDLERDRAAGEHNYLGYYASSTEAADRLAAIARSARALTAALPRAGRHRAILAGVAAFYLSAPEAKTDYAEPIRERLLLAMGRGASLLTAFIGIRRLGERRRPGQAGNSPGP